MRRLPLVTIAALLLAAPAAHAEDTGDPGRALYLRYCGACHGPDAKGNGVAGTFMRPKPPDLTLLAVENGGTFPMQQVKAYIDGSTDVRAHGDPTMPVWGEVFQAEAGWSQTRRTEVETKLMTLTAYLRSIQQPAPKP